MFGSSHVGAMLVLCGTFAGALIWAARRLHVQVWIYVGFFTLAGSIVPTSMLMTNHLPTWASIALFVYPSLALIVAAMLLLSGLELRKEERTMWTVANGDLQAKRKRFGKAAALAFVLCALLLVKTFYNLYWLLIWDSTTDPLGYFWLVIPDLAAIYAGILLAYTLPDRMKSIGILYAILVPALMLLVFVLARQIDFRQLTEARAKRISLAIETYFAREGHYPQDLQHLRPRYLFWLSGPVTLYGQDWCYEGGDNFYRLGYVDREHWSDPRLIGRIFSAKGDAPALRRMCEAEVIALQTRNPDYPYSYWMETGE